MTNLEFDLSIPNQAVDQPPKLHDLGNGKITEFRSFCESAKADEYFKNSYKPVLGVMTRLRSLEKPFQYQGYSAGWEILGQFTHIQA